MPVQLSSKEEGFQKCQEETAHNGRCDRQTFKVLSFCSICQTGNHLSSPLGMCSLKHLLRMYGLFPYEIKKGTVLEFRK